MRIFSILILGFVLAVVCGCEPRPTIDVIRSSDDYAIDQYRAVLKKVPSELTHHFPSADELVDGWRLAYSSKGLQSSTHMQLEQQCSAAQVQEIKNRFLRSWGVDTIDGNRVSGFKPLFGDESVTGTDELYLGKEMNTPNMFGLLVRQRNNSVVHFLIYDH